MNENCIFCQIIQHQVPAYVVTEDEHIIVFLSKENHPLMVPKQHIPNIYSLDEETGAHIMRVTVKVARAVKAGLECEGIYLTQANGPAADQDVFHFHLHIYPRWQTVDFRSQQITQYVRKHDKEEILQKIIACLQ